MNTSPGLRWFHITWSTVNAWLPGDERGFRSKDHKIHSSGDHRNPPPNQEHAGLRKYWQQRAGKPILIPSELRAIIGKAVLAKLLALGYRVLAISVGGRHVHVQVEMPDHNATIKREIGLCKRASSLAVTKRLPGRLWQRLPGIKPINDHGHQENTFNYIPKHAQEGAWVWSFREPVPEECIPKKSRKRK
jgi:REP element-mobilizing transposase RayT